MLAAERLTPFCRREAAALTLMSGPADMVRLVRTLRVRRGARRREKGSLSSATRTGAVRLVRTLRVRRDGPRRQARTLGVMPIATKSWASCGP